MSTETHASEQEQQLAEREQELRRREEALAAREAALTAAETGKELSEERQEMPSEELESAAKQQARSIERIYKHLEWIPLKALDAFIALCVAAFFGVIVFGYLRSHGYF